MALPTLEFIAFLNGTALVSTSIHGAKKNFPEKFIFLLTRLRELCHGRNMSPQIDPNEQVLIALSEALKAELTAVNQYLLHARMCENWGYRRLAEYNRKESLEELAHAEILMDRILFLRGTPDMTDLFPMKIGASVKAQLESDLALEMEAIARLNKAVKIATEAGDNATRQLFDKILLDEDHHVDYLEGQLHVINEIGLNNYLAQQIHGTAAN